MIDTQLHLVDPRFPFATGGYRPNANEVGDLDALIGAMDGSSIGQGVLVQPSAYGTDNSAIFDALARYPARFRAIVMTGDPAAVAQVPGVVGVRLNLTDYAPHAGIATDLANAILGDGLILQLQARPEVIARLLDAVPAGPIVIDHLGRPASLSDAALLAGCAARPETWLKVSGGFRVPGAWPDPAPHLKTLVAAFSPTRVVWGSDWPFLNCDRRPTLQDAVMWAAGLCDLRLASENAAGLFGFETEATSGNRDTTTVGTA